MNNENTQLNTNTKHIMLYGVKNVESVIILGLIDFSTAPLCLYLLFLK